MRSYVKKYLNALNLDKNSFLCEVCGKKGVDVHHIIFRSQGGSDELINLMGVCRKCHDRAHNKQKPFLSREFMQNKHLDFLILKNGNNFIKKMAEN